MSATEDRKSMAKNFIERESKQQIFELETKVDRAKMLKPAQKLEPKII